MRGLAFFLVGFWVFGHGVEMVDFDSSKTGVMPPEWTAGMTHRGLMPRWVVHPDVTAPSRPNVFAQLTPDHNRVRFALAVFNKVDCKNADLSVDLKIVSGKADQTAGLIWRYQNPENYYLLHVSANEDNIGLFRVENSKVIPVARQGVGIKNFEVRHRIDIDEWNVVKAVIRDSHVTVYFDHRRVMEADDNTFLKPGKTGLWTKGDTIAYFDNFRVEKKKD